MQGKIIAAGLRARPVRTSVSVLAVALEVTMILSIVGLVDGMLKGSAELVSEAGADVMVAPLGVSAVVAGNSTTLPETMEAKLAALDHVKAVSPIIVATSTSKKKVLNVWGIDPDTYDKVTGGFRFIEGRLFAADDEAIVDDLMAKDLNLRAGSPLELLSRPYRVSGIVAHGKGARVMMHIEALRKVQSHYGLDEKTNKLVGKVTYFFLKLNGPNLFEAFKEENPALTSGYNVINIRDYLDQMRESFPGLDEFRIVVVLIAMCVGVLVIFLSTYTGVTERTREIGILRSLGAKKRLIVALVVQESLLICAVGAVVGTAASFGIAVLVSALFPTQALEITGYWIGLSIVLALLSGVLGSIYPAVKAARQDPIEALAYE
jgi:putative ABC transport system permease protein